MQTVEEVKTSLARFPMTEFRLRSRGYTSCRFSLPQGPYKVYLSDLPVIAEILHQHLVARSGWRPPIFQVSTLRCYIRDSLFHYFQMSSIYR